jgi:excisionase family DNA binding protein
MRTVDSWLHSRKIPSIKLGRAVRFRWPAVEAALLRHERQASM